MQLGLLLNILVQHQWRNCNQMRTLIKTAGRTGSHVIAWQELERLGIDQLYHNHDLPPQELYQLAGPCVVHDHTKTVPNNSRDWDLIVSLRRSVYDQAISYCMARATNNFGHAQAADGDFIIDDELFLISLKNFKVVNYYWQLMAAATEWNSVRTVYWEDLLPLDRAYTRNHPGADHSRVVNHDQLRTIAQRYCDNHNWAIREACEQAQQQIGTITERKAREIIRP